jgi:hypothetical protein
MKKVMLFDCCYPIKGANRSLILDTQRLEFEFIPNSLYEILENHNGKSIQEIKDIYNNEHDETIDEYLAFLDDKEFIFYTNDETNFPKSTLSFDVPSFIDNSLIDFGNYLSIPLLRNILKQLTNLGCRVIQIRSWNIERELSQLTSFLDTLKGFNLDSIEIIWNLMEKISEEELKTFISKYPIELSHDK